jgi:hypothetical protein
MNGGGLNVYVSVEVLARLYGLVTVTATDPAAPAGDVAVTDVPFTTVTLVACTAPKDTVAPGAKFVPEI